ncbi:MAG TPA: metallophosphoesterase [Candidatus Lustribacter sp.]|nr:metallophosphoesterase [Candidatus Lustribacter sp.]
MATTIVHAADVHLETVFPDVRGGGARRAALADAFDRIVDLALERHADILTIGGDLYESERAGPATARFLFAAFARFGKPVFVAPGNHDPFAARSIYARDDLPPNVRVFADASWTAVPLAPNLTLYGFGHTPAEPGRPFAGQSFDRSGVRIALVHGSDEERCPPGKRATAPFNAAEIRAAGTTLALTGHYHGGSIVSDDAGPVFAYPGSPEPIKFGERGEHGALVVTVNDDASIAIESVPIARTHLIDVSISIDDAGDESAVIVACERALGSYGKNDFVRATLRGTVQQGTRVNRALLAERAGAGLGALDLVDRSVIADYAAIAHESNVRGRAVAELLAAADGGDEDARRALALVVAAFDGAEIAP